MTADISNGKYGTILVKVSGDITVYQADSFKRIMRRVAREEGGRKKIVIDMAEVGILDPLALGVITAAAREARQDGGDIKLASMSPGIKKLFDRTRLSSTYGIYPSVNEAVKSYRFLQ